MSRAPAVAADLSSFMAQTQLPPLMDFSQSDTKFKNFTTVPNVPCFSNHTNLQQQDLIYGFSANNQNPLMGFGQSDSNIFLTGNYGSVDAVMRSYLNNNNNWPSVHFKCEREMVSASQETGLTNEVNVKMNSNEISSSSSLMEMVRSPFEDGSASGVGPIDLECIWPY